MTNNHIYRVRYIGPFGNTAVLYKSPVKLTRAKVVRRFQDDHPSCRLLKITEVRPKKGETCPPVR